MKLGWRFIRYFSTKFDDFGFIKSLEINDVSKGTIKKVVFKVVFDEIGRITERIIYNSADNQMLRKYSFEYINDNELNYNMIDYADSYNSFDILAMYNSSGVITEYIYNNDAYSIKYNSLDQIVDFYGLLRCQFEYDKFGNPIREYCMDESGRSDEEPGSSSQYHKYKYDRNLNWIEKKKR